MEIDCHTECRLSAASNYKYKITFIKFGYLLRNYVLMFLFDAMRLCLIGNPMLLAAPLLVVFVLLRRPLAHSFSLVWPFVTLGKRPSVVTVRRQERVSLFGNESVLGFQVPPSNGNKDSH